MRKGQFMNPHDLVCEFLEEEVPTSNEFALIVQGFISEINEKYNYLPTNVSRNRVVFCSWVQQARLINRFFSYAKTRKPSHGEWFIKHGKDGHASSFVNREDELRVLLGAAESDKFFLISAPPGYGKSWLINEIEIRLQKQEHGEYKKWEYIVIRVEAQDTFADVSTKIAEQLSFISMPKMLQNASDTLIQSYRVHRMEQSEKDLLPDGVFWLFDFEEKPNIEVFDILVTKVLPNFFDNVDSQFEKNIKRRIALIGRFIVPGRKKGSESDYRWNEAGSFQYADSPDFLSPFEYNHVYDSIKKRLKFSPERTQEIAAHIFYCTGGHPGSMATLIDDYKNKGVLFNSCGSQDEVWNNFVKDKAEKVYSELMNLDEVKKDGIEVWRIFEKLSIFDQIPESALKVCVQEHKALTFINLRYLLKDTFMLGMENNILIDSIYRRLVLLHLQYEHPDRLEKYLKWGKNILDQVILQDNNVANWAFSWLEVRLRQETSHFLDEDERKILRDVVIPRITGELKSLYKRRWQRTSIESRDRDIEYLYEVATGNKKVRQDFAFLLNYHLRDDVYTSKPYEKFVETLNAWRKENNEKNY